MSDLSVSNLTSESQGWTDRSAERRTRALRRAHESRIRFHLLLNLGFALAALWVLKIDGPYYADGISAGLLFCGVFVSLWSRAEIRNSESSAGAIASRALHLLFLALPVFFAAAAVAVVYYTYLVPPDMPFSDEEGITQTGFNLSLLRRQFA